MKVLLICGGQSTENEVSRMSATNIRKNMNPKYEITTIGISKEGKWYELNHDNYTSDSWLENAKEIKNILEYLKTFDVIFPALHGLYGEDGTIQGLFELARVPYVGMKVLGSSVSLDKVYTKIILDKAGIKQTPSLYVKKKYDNSLVVIDNNIEKDNIEELVKKKLGYPVFIKASNSGSSIGCYKVESASDLIPKLKEASKYDRKILIEKAINARELECAVLGNDDIVVSVVGEIIPNGEYYTYDSKYNDEKSFVKIPADISKKTEKYIQDAAIKTFKALDGHGLSRCDFFLDKDTNEVYLNEINTMPGFTNISMYPMLMEYIGIKPTELIDRLIELAIEAYHE